MKNIILITLLLFAANTASSESTIAKSTKLKLRPVYVEPTYENTDLNTYAWYEIHNYFQNFSLNGFSESLTTLTLSGFGDKSFFVTTVASISFNNWTVAIASFFALSIMGLISVFLGVEATKFIPAVAINLISVSLFLLMGIKMMLEGLEMNENKKEDSLEESIDNDSNGCCDEKEKIINEKKAHFIIENDEIYNSDINIEENEAIINIGDFKPKLEFPNNSYNPIINNFIYEFSQIFMVVFLGELGDRSQISTMYMTNQTTICNVVSSVIVSNIILSALSVMFGQFISQKLSMKSIYIYTGGSFVLFGMITMFICMQEDFRIFDYYSIENN